MPTNTPNAALPYPNGGEAPNGPGAVMALATAADKQVVLKATSLSDRDSRFGNIDAGQLVSCSALKTVWMKTSTPPSAATWVTVAEIGTPATSGVATAAADFSISGQWAQRINGTLHIRIQSTYSGSPLVGGTVGSANPGDIADTTIFTLQSAWQPPTAALWWPFSFVTSSGSGGNGLVKGSGQVQLTNMSASAVLNTGATVWVALTIPAA